jgi:Sel1 repeat
MQRHQFPLSPEIATQPKHFSTSELHHRHIPSTARSLLHCGLSQASKQARMKNPKMSPFQLPPLYFQDKGSSFAASSESSLTLPAEVLHKCLTEYASWGDLAKLACIQTGWKNIMYDAAKASPYSQWKLACALLEGTDGLTVHFPAALLLLQQLAVVDVDPHTHAPILRTENNNNNNNTSNDDNDQAASEYSAKAMKKLAYFYLEQGGSPETGLAWLECAFHAGKDVEAAHDLAIIYEYGRYSVPTDVVAAAVYFETAARAGHVEAMAELALCYELGCGVEASDETALDWYMKAAVAGHVTAKYAVGEAFEEARGVPQSDEEACLWYYKAAVAGDEDSRRALRRLESIARIVVPGVRALLDG